MLPKKRPPTHPGEMLLKEFLTPMGITQQEMAYLVGLSRQRVNEALAAPDGSTWKAAVTETSTFRGGTFESTPIVWDGRVYIGCRDGYLYCLGAK